MLRFLDNVRQAAVGWLEGDNYKKAAVYGRRLNRFRKYFPPEVVHVPSLTLYRLIKVRNTAFDKCLKDSKPLILKDRRYSSWTWDLENAQDFAGNDLDYTNIIFAKTFSPDDIVANIPALFNFLSEEIDQQPPAVREPIPKGLLNIAKREYEAVVRNSSDDYKVTAKDILEYRRPSGGWRPLHHT